VLVILSKKKAETGRKFRFQFLLPHSRKSHETPSTIIFKYYFFRIKILPLWKYRKKKIRYILIENFIKKILIRETITAFNNKSG